MNDSDLRAPAMLMNMGRYDEAERRLREVLLSDPQNASAHVLLSTCLLERKAYDEATNEAETAVGLQPDAPQTHFAMARVWHARRYADRAMQALEQAIRLDPHDADFHAFRAALLFEQSRWQDALAAAEAALAIEPEHVGANNFRAMALVKLGRRSEAGQTIDAALARDPEDAFSHANKGWALLEAHKPKEALGHFREALRLEPNLEYARVGIIEALKARNPLYGFFLRYALWMAKLPPRWQFGVILGAFLGNRLLRGVARENPALEPYLMPIFVAYGVFAIWTWLARPIFNLLLRLHPLGKHALSPEEKTETNWIGGLLGAALLCAAASFFIDESGVLIVAAMMLGALALPAYLYFQASPGWPRKILLGAIAVMGWALAAVLMAVWNDDVLASTIHTQTFLFTWLATVWGGQLVAAATPKR
ncbi:MAG: tetratricopeptide repeat protein [Pirellulales bacterium]